MSLCTENTSACGPTRTGMIGLWCRLNVKSACFSKRQSHKTETNNVISPAHPKRLESVSQGRGASSELLESRNGLHEVQTTPSSSRIHRLLQPCPAAVSNMRFLGVEAPILRQLCLDDTCITREQNSLTHQHSTTINPSLDLPSL
jgi:hypothetical protein